MTPRIGLWEGRTQRTDNGIYHGPSQEDSKLQPLSSYSEGASDSENGKPSLSLLEETIPKSYCALLIFLITKKAFSR